MTRWIVAATVGFLMLCEMLFNVPDLFAGAFDQLSPGNQKAARSLFEAQRSDPPPGTRALTLDEIAARKQNGEGWGRIFNGMKAQGLTDAKNFGETVSSFNHRHHGSASGPHHGSSNGAITSAANRTIGVRHDSTPRVTGHDRGARGGPARVTRHDGSVSAAGAATNRGPAASTVGMQTRAHGGGAGHGRGGHR